MDKVPDWLQEKGVQQFFAATRAEGGEARAVGGAVRDHVMGMDALDVDFASTLLPAHTMEIAKANGWKAIPTGIDHGTVTLVLPERVVEVTTLRRDEQTDGRHAVVAYTDRFEEDAARRDFTLNALYMDADGTLYDYTGGTEDCQTRSVRFIGLALTRIAEDGLRILRYFRFLATHGAPPADAEALQAVTEKKDMIAALSGERIAQEMRKWLGADSPAYSLRLLAEAGIAPLIFGRDILPARMIRLQMLEAQADYRVSVWARVLALLPHAAPTDAAFLSARWKLSRHETEQLRVLISLPVLDVAAPRHVHTRILRVHGAPTYLDWILLQAATVTGVDVAAFVTLAHTFIAPKFPVSAHDLMARGMTEGKALGDKLAALERRWEEGDYSLSKEQLLQQ